MGNGTRSLREHVRLLVGALALGCGSEQHLDLPQDQVWTSPHFRYAARADDPGVCGAVVDQLEAHFQALGDYLGLAFTGGVIDYYKFRDAEDFHKGSGCPPAATACARPADVRSTRALDGHELIHVYTAALGHPPALLEEGLAVALAPEGRVFLAPSATWREILAMPPLPNGAWPDVDYLGGGWFVTYLLREHGPAPFLAFYQGAAASPAADALARHFHDSYGLDLDEAWSQARTSAPRLPGVPVWECASARPMTLGGDAAPVADSCDGHGAYAGLDLPVPTAVTWSEERQLGFSITGCAPGAGLYALFPDDWYQPGALALPAGRYCVTPSPFHAATTPRETVKLREAPDVVGADCSELSPLGLGPNNPGTVAVVLGNSTDPWFARPEPPQGGSFRLESYPDLQRPFGETAATVEACATCEGPCRIIDASFDPEVASGTILRFTNLTSFEGAAVARLRYRW